MKVGTKQSRARERKESRIIFASSCVESAARERNVSSTEMYQRMKRVGLISGFILKCYDGLHTQSRQHVTQDVLGALDIWEAKPERALDIFYTSKTNERLHDPSTLLYTFSDLYIVDDVIREIQSGT